MVYLIENHKINKTVLNIYLQKSDNAEMSIFVKLMTVQVQHKTETIQPVQNIGQ